MNINEPKTRVEKNEIKMNQPPSSMAPVKTARG